MGNEHSRAASHAGAGPEDNAGTDSAPSPAVSGTGLARYTVATAPVAGSPAAAVFSLHLPPGLVVPAAGISPEILKQYRTSTLSLADFTLKRTLGTGSFGRVMLAQHKATKHWVAIKVLRKDKVVKMKQVEHAKYEKQILDEIKCPFVVNLLAFFQDAKNLYLVLEYVRGGEMFTHLRKAGRFTDEVAKFYAAEVVLAWEYIHSRSIIYRDLKPENLLINADGHLKARAA